MNNFNDIENKLENLDYSNSFQNKDKILNTLVNNMNNGEYDEKMKIRRLKNPIAIIIAISTCIILGSITVYGEEIKSVLKQIITDNIQGTQVDNLVSDYDGESISLAVYVKDSDLNLTDEEKKLRMEMPMEIHKYNSIEEIDIDISFEPKIPSKLPNGISLEQIRLLTIGDEIVADVQTIYSYGERKHALEITQTTLFGGYTHFETTFPIEEIKIGEHSAILIDSSFPGGSSYYLLIDVDGYGYHLRSHLDKNTTIKIAENLIYE